MSALGFAATVLLFCAAPSWGTESAVAPGPKDLLTQSPYTNLGSHHKPISTQVAATQQYFDQGLRFMYGFNHAEAIRSFTRAAELDPTCAMCYWGSPSPTARTSTLPWTRRAELPRTPRRKRR